MLAKNLFSLTLLALVFSVSNGVNTDLTIVDKAVGQDVVDAVVFLIENSGIFSTTNGLLKRIAYVESKFGNDPNTFAQRNGQDYNGGIWNVDNTAGGAFAESQNVAMHQELAVLYTKIKDHFGIDWPGVTWAQCRLPLVSGLAARIALSVKYDPIPATLELQAKWWLTNYKSAATKGTEESFIADIKAMDRLETCNGRMDLAIVLDGSGSIQAPNFDLAKKFVADLIGTFSLDNVNLGFVLFSDVSQVIFPADSGLTLDQMKDKVLNIHYPAYATNTSGAILTAVDLLKAAKHREGSPRIMAIFTDGAPDAPVTASVAVARTEEIAIFAVGIGAQINQANLLDMAYNDPTRVFSMTNYDTLSTSFEMMNTEACKVPQIPDLGKSVHDNIGKDEKRYFCFDMPNDGLTVNITVTLGIIETYFSYLLKNPSAAFNNGTLTINGKTYIPHVTYVNSTYVCITIVGVGEKNEYTIEVEHGDTTSHIAPTDATVVPTASVQPTHRITDDPFGDPLQKIKKEAIDIAEKAFAKTDNNYNAIANEICNELSKMYYREEWICIVGEKVEISEHQRAKSMFQIGFEIKQASVYLIINVPDSYFL